jgi:hypothetical protein
MVDTQASAGRYVLAACFVICSMLQMPQRATAQDIADASAPAPSTAVIHFDLPAQPLAQALHAYGRLTQLLVMAQTSLIAGHMSTSVSGDYSPRDALQHLLAGTGFEASFSHQNEAIILPASPTADPSSSQAPATASSPAVDAVDIDGVMKGGDHRAYAALLQTRLTQTLCASPLTRPGTYRLLVRLGIDPSGAVVAPQIVESTGDPARDTAIEQALRVLILDTPPPPALPQPITVLLRPQGNGVDTQCSQFSAQDQ